MDEHPNSLSTDEDATDNQGASSPTSISHETSVVASSDSSRRSSTIRRTSSKRKPCGVGGSSLAGAPVSTLRQQRSSDLEEERSLTSFPSFSPESSPNVAKGKSKIVSRDGAFRSSLVVKNDVTPRQQPRKNLVETLMSRSSPSTRDRDSLFADSPATTTQDVPGALHHASDDHIKRLIAKRGNVALIRQLASDLAQREAEMTTLRLRAESRERELKRMLREVEVSNLDIERRLHTIDERGKSPDSTRNNRNSLTSVGDLVGEALGDTLDNNRDEETFLTETAIEDKQATIRAAGQPSNETESLSSSVESIKKQGWMNYFLGSSSTVRKQQTTTPLSGETEISRTTSATGRRKGINESTFRPPHEDDAQRDSSMTRVSSHTSETAPRRVSKSSWTLKLFAGNNPNSKDGDLNLGRGRSSTTASDATKSLRDVSRDSRNTSGSATVRANRQGKRQSLQAVGTSIPIKGDARSVSNVPLASPKSFETSENLGPVEMDAILPHGSRPPTLSPQELGDSQSDILTDRFGFIYDQRRRKKEADAMARLKVTTAKKETIGNPFEFPISSDIDSARSGTPTSFNDTDDNEVITDTIEQTTGSWQDYLKSSIVSGELLSQTPAPPTVPVVEGSKMTTNSTLKRVPTFNDDVLVTSPNPAPSASNVTAAKAEIAKPIMSGSSTTSPAAGPSNDAEPVKILLAQLGDLHDRLQREKAVKWNEFMRKVRAERRREGDQTNSGDARGKTEPAEAQIADGEIIGISSLGHKGKVGRAKYREFRLLVLAGIPIVHRAKIWSECSGAHMLRVPGNYQDLVSGQSDEDPTILAQIEMDINRTLTDNVFFRSGPGVAKLNEILLAYARRNPEVGYCQGMNLITASLLLIMPTSEDAFWILASLVEGILPRHYYDNSLLASRADQQVLRSYVSELLPKLAQHLENMSVELEALTFQWFLSLFTACLSAEALYRVWDVLLCLNQDPANGGSTFLFQVALALLKLNENQLLACETPGEVYAYLGGEITNHAISIDGLIRASEGLKTLVKRDEVEERRKKWVAIEDETIKDRERIRNGVTASTVRPTGAIAEA